MAVTAEITTTEQGSTVVCSCGERLTARDRAQADRVLARHWAEHRNHT